MFNADARRAIEAVAEDINVPPDALLAVAEVESAGKAFATVYGRQEPLIRWEGHYFDRLVPAGKRAQARASGLASPKAGAVKNPRSQEARYDMLERARRIDEDAAISSCSWGLGQVMGSHWKWLGYASPRALEDEARSGIAGQVRLMAKYIKAAKLDDELRRHDWSGFARGYNGPAYARYGYHTKIAAAYRRYAGEGASPSKASGMLRLGSKGARVREVQQLLVRAGYPVDMDGDFGPATKQAVENFQKHNVVRPVDGIVGPATMAALQKFRVAPDEDLGKQNIAQLPEAPAAGVTTVAGVTSTVAADQINEMADKIGTTGVSWIDYAVYLLYFAAAVLIIGGLAYGAWGWLKSRETYEGVS